MKRQVIFLFLSLIVIPLHALTIVSWNIRDFGQSRTDQEIRDIAQVIRHADIVAIQEVVAIHPGGAQAVARLVNQLNNMGSKWDYSISDPTQSTSSQKSERYAFLWKTSKLTVTGGGPRLLSELTSYVEREPYFIKLKHKNIILEIINYHACTHKETFPERGEIMAISQWLIKNKSKNVIWAGDMNLNINDIAFDYITDDGYKSVINGEKTSLKKKCKNGNYLSKGEDNILYKLADVNFKSANVLDFIKGKDCNLVSVLRDSYSDHLAVEVVLN